MNKYNLIILRDFTPIPIDLIRVFMYFMNWFKNNMTKIDYVRI